MPHGARFSVVCNPNIYLEAAPPSPPELSRTPAPMGLAPRPPRCLPSLATALPPVQGQQGLLWKAMSVVTVITRAAEIPQRDSGEKCSPVDFGVMALPCCGVWGWGFWCHRECPGQLKVVGDAPRAATELQPQDHHGPCTGVPFPPPTLTLHPSTATACHSLPLHVTPALLLPHSGFVTSPCPVLGMLPGSLSWSSGGEAGKSCGGSRVGRGASLQTPPLV